jgi:hypothetical protein
MSRSRLASFAYREEDSVNGDFELLGEVQHIELIAVGSSIRELSYLQKVHGKGRWRKLKGTAQVRLHNGRIRKAEIHWYEAHGVGRREMKIKRYLD